MGSVKDSVTVKFDGKLIVKWLYGLLYLELPELHKAILRFPYLGKYEEPIRETVGHPFKTSSNLFFTRRAVMQAVVGIFSQAYNDVKYPSEDYKTYHDGLMEINFYRNNLLKLDLPQFIEGVTLAFSVGELCEVLDPAPAQFQDGILSLWEEKLPFQEDHLRSRFRTVEKAKEIIWQVANATGNESCYSPAPSAWKSWLEDEIPLLPASLTQPLVDDYYNQGYVYDNFDDVMAPWDEGIFRNNALERIKNWLKQY